MFIRYWIMHVHVCIEYTYSERENVCSMSEAWDLRLPSAIKKTTTKKNIQTVDAYIITLPTNNTFHRSRWDKNGNMFHSQIHLPEKNNIPKVIFKYLSHGLSSQLGINKKQENSRANMILRGLKQATIKAPPETASSSAPPSCRQFTPGLKGRTSAAVIMPTSHVMYHHIFCLQVFKGNLPIRKLRK